MSVESIEIPPTEGWPALKVAIANAVAALASEGVAATVVELPPWAVALIESAPARELGSQLRSDVTKHGIAALPTLLGLRVQVVRDASSVRVK